MDKRVKHQIETRIEARRLFDAGFGCGAVSTHLGVPAGTVRIWQDKHRQGLLLVLDIVSKKKQYSQALKLAAVEKFLSGTSITDVLIEFEISNRSLFNKWVALYRTNGADGLAAKPKGRRPQESDPGKQSLEERLYFLEMENAVLKKFQALMQEKDALLKQRKP